MPPEFKRMQWAAFWGKRGKSSIDKVALCKIVLRADQQRLRRQTVPLSSRPCQNKLLYHLFITLLIAISQWVLMTFRDLAVGWIKKDEWLGSHDSADQHHQLCLLGVRTQPDEFKASWRSEDRPQLQRWHFLSGRRSNTCREQMSLSANMLCIHQSVGQKHSDLLGLCLNSSPRDAFDVVTTGVTKFEHKAQLDSSCSTTSPTHLHAGMSSDFFF